MPIVLLPNPDKPDAVAAAEGLRELLKAQGSHCAVVTSPTVEGLAGMSPSLVVVLGGDGSILKCAHAMGGIGAPVAGINFGKLGYMAAFSLEQFRRYLPKIVAGEVRVTERTMLHGAIYRLPAAGDDVQPLGKLLAMTPRFEYTALNDVAINAGEPFRMIELEVQIDGHETAPFRSDGVIVATASGSTGYNLSAGGPLISPEVRAMVLTPICPHSLSFRPVVVADTSTIVIRMLHLNAGSAVNFDGQVSQSITDHDCVVVRRAPRPLRLLENPEMSHWGMLAHKLHWAQSPRG
jgi:NAD+ kinase